MRGRLCSNKRPRWPLVCMGGWNWLVWIILWAGKGLKPAPQEQVCPVLGPHDKEGCLARGPYLQEQRREGKLSLLQLRSSWLQMSRQQVILNLNGRFYTIESALASQVSLCLRKCSVTSQTKSSWQVERIVRKETQTARHGRDEKASCFNMCNVTLFFCCCENKGCCIFIMHWALQIV